MVLIDDPVLLRGTVGLVQLYHQLVGLYSYMGQTYREVTTVSRVPSCIDSEVRVVTESDRSALLLRQVPEVRRVLAIDSDYFGTFGNIDLFVVMVVSAAMLLVVFVVVGLVQRWLKTLAIFLADDLDSMGFTVLDSGILRRRRGWVVIASSKEVEGGGRSDRQEYEGDQSGFHRVDAV